MSNPRAALCLALATSALVVGGCAASTEGYEPKVVDTSTQRWDSRLEYLTHACEAPNLLDQTKMSLTAIAGAQHGGNNATDEQVDCLLGLLGMPDRRRKRHSLS